MCFSKRRVAQQVAFLFLLLLLFGYILFPALKTVEKSLFVGDSYSLLHYRELFVNKTLRLPLLNSILLGALSVVVCGSVGVTLAFFVHFFKFPGSRVLDKLLFLPMVLPGIIIVLAFQQLYGESGMVTKGVQFLLGLESAPFALSGLSGILFIHAYTQYVYFYITVSIAIRHMDYSVIESARSLGASTIKVVFSVILPFLKPALLAASAMTFISGAGSFTAPSVIGGSFKVMTTQILLSKANNYLDVAATQVSVLTVISILFFIIFRYYETRSQFRSLVKGVPFRQVVLSNSRLRILFVVVAAMLVVLIVLPIIAILLISFVPSSLWMVHYFPNTLTVENYSAIFTNGRKLQPFVNSLLMSFLAASFGLMVAIPTSYGIVKSSSRLKWLIELLVMLPWAIPASAMAINLIVTFSKPSFFSCNTVLLGSSLLLPLGYLICSLPIMVKTVGLSFQNLNEMYIEASKSLGATGAQTFQKISIPIVYPGILAGFLLIFIRSMGEYTLSVFLCNASNKPISITMVNEVFEYNLGGAMTYGTLILLFTFCLSVVITRVLRNVSFAGYVLR